MIKKISIGLIVGVLVIVGLKFLLAIIPMPVSRMMVQDICINSETVDFLIYDVSGSGSTSLGPHPSYRINWKSAELYRLSYKLAPSATELSPEKLKVKSSNSAIKEPFKQHNFSDLGINCGLTKKDEYSVFTHSIEPNTPEFISIGLPSNVELGRALGVETQEFGTCFKAQEKFAVKNVKFFVSCPTKKLSAKFVASGYSFGNLYYDPSKQRFLFYAGDSISTNKLSELYIFSLNKNDNKKYDLIWK